MTLRQAILGNWSLLASIFVFSVFVNLLYLTGPLFMMQVYDRVLASGSVPTLVVLLGLVVGLYAMMALLDMIRTRVGARTGAQLQDQMDKTVFNAVIDARGDMLKQSSTALSDLEAVRRFLGSPYMFAMFDLPFVPVFLAATFLFHPDLGWFSLAGILFLAFIMIINQAVSKRPSETAAVTAARASRMAEQIRLNGETVRGLGMTEHVVDRWAKERNTALDAEIRLGDRNGGFGAWVKAFRLLLQSGLLALGAWLVIQGEMTAGAMIASSTLMGRALAPVEQLVGGWSNVVRASKGWTSLSELLAKSPQRKAMTELPFPEARLTVQDVTMVPPGASEPTVRRASFSIGPGEAVGIIGESASGKSTMARALAGVWRPAAGEIRLGGAKLEHYSERQLTAAVGYLPQDIALLEGTVAENIARFIPEATSEQIIEAAQLAGAHDVILKLPKGYDTDVGAIGSRLSGGQKQRIGLARALFGKPALVVLDEANSNLDAPGSEALNAAIRRLKAEGRMVITIAHRPAAIAECDKLVVMRDGAVAAFGPRDEVLAKMTRPATVSDIRTAQNRTAGTP
jgi:ATP-binding cassette, subfamily C, bacterial